MTSVYINKMQCSASYFYGNFFNLTLKVLTIFEWNWLTDFTLYFCAVIFGVYKVKSSTLIYSIHYISWGPKLEASEMANVAIDMECLTVLFKNYTSPNSTGPHPASGVSGGRCPSPPRGEWGAPDIPVGCLILRCRLSGGRVECSDGSEEFVVLSRWWGEGWTSRLVLWFCFLFVIS